MKIVREILGIVLRNPTGACIAVIIPLIVWAWHALVQPRYLGAIVAELGAVREFRNAPKANTDGTKLLFCQSMETGFATYLYDVASGERRTLNDGAAWLLGWSPDDHYFAYETGRAIKIYDSTTGLLLASVRYPAKKNLTDIGWMSNDTLFARDDSGTLFSISRKNGLWGFETFALSRQPEEALREDFVPLNNSEIAWRQGNSFWSASSVSASLLKLFEVPPEITVISSKFDRRTGEFLLHCKDANGASLAVANGGRFRRLQSLGKARLTSFGWAGDRGGYFYSITIPDNKFRIFVKADSSSNFKQLDVSSSPTTIANQNFLYTITSDGLEPTAIWTYDLRTQAFGPLVPNSEKPFKHTALVESQRFNATNASGKRVPYTLFRPARFSSKRKYPVVLTGQRGYGQLVANAGAYCAIVYGGGDAPPEDYLAVIQDLSSQTSVDLKRLYLMGFSKGILPPVAIAMQNPGLCRGLILLSPANIPFDVIGSKVSKILIDTGSKDFPGDDGITGLKQFQDEAMVKGIYVALSISNQGHGYTALNAERKRAEEIANFIQ